MYLHGSAHQFSILPIHWGFVGYLARELDAEVVVVPYPLAPTNIATEIIPVLMQAYQSFIERSGNREVIVAGDSAGGQLAMCIAYAAHDNKIPLPSQIISICPVANLEMDGAGMTKIAPNDIFLSPGFIMAAVRIWLLGRNSIDVPLPREILDNPHYNPSAGDASVLVRAGTKLIVAAGTWDVLYADIEPWVNTVVKTGVEMTYIVGEGQFHGFPVTVDVSPECTRAAELIVQQVIANSKLN